MLIKKELRVDWVVSQRKEACSVVKCNGGCGSPNEEKLITSRHRTYLGNCKRSQNINVLFFPLLYGLFMLAMVHEMTFDLTTLP